MGLREISPARSGATPRSSLRSAAAGSGSIGTESRARFTRVPAIGFGPPGIHRAHIIDEWVKVDDLVACAQALAVTALRFSA
jgi:acetylornithine deacetylase/succinyl-diaminopimelate desuccinylase-like protein